MFLREVKAHLAFYLSRVISCKGYRYTCGPKRHGFLAVFIIIRYRFCPFRLIIGHGFLRMSSLKQSRIRTRVSPHTSLGWYPLWIHHSWLIWADTKRPIQEEFYDPFFWSHDFSCFYRLGWFISDHKPFRCKALRAFMSADSEVPLIDIPPARDAQRKMKRIKLSL